MLKPFPILHGYLRLSHDTRDGRPPSPPGLKATRPDLDIWIVTGDGDSLSIGGNHLLHLFRRNLDVTLLLFNNQVYGLTKGQYSPTSPTGQKVVHKSMVGSIDTPFNPLRIALAANAPMIIRSIDRDLKHMGSHDSTRGGASWRRLF